MLNIDYPVLGLCRINRCLYIENPYYAYDTSRDMGPGVRIQEYVVYYSIPGLRKFLVRELPCNHDFFDTTTINNILETEPHLFRMKKALSIFLFILFEYCTVWQKCSAGMISKICINSNSSRKEISFSYVHLFK